MRKDEQQQNKQEVSLALSITAVSSYQISLQYLNHYGKSQDKIQYLCGGEEQENSLKTLKDAMSNASELGYFKMDAEETQIIVDSSRDNVIYKRNSTHVKQEGQWP